MNSYQYIQDPLGDGTTSDKAGIVLHPGDPHPQEPKRVYASEPTFTSIPLEDYIGSIHNITLRDLCNTMLEVVVAGGCFETDMRGHTPKDFDIYAMSNEDFESAKIKIINKGWIVDIFQPAPFYMTNFSRPNYPDIQLIHNYAQEPEDVLADFDFTACMIGAYNGRVYFGSTTLMNIACRELVLNMYKIESPKQSLFKLYQRIEKYSLKGYYVTTKLLRQIHDRKRR